tara:strand:- start:149 stop:535 length:387 start_codon:yes stop_codon:yes gene_type:complete
MTEIEKYSSNQNYIVNVTEVRGTPLIVISAYECLLLLVGFYIIKWLAWILKPICTEKKDGLPLVNARPIRGWLNENFNFTNTPTSQASRNSHSAFELSDSDEEREIERGNGNTGQDGNLESPSRVSEE